MNWLIQWGVPLVLSALIAAAVAIVPDMRKRGRRGEAMWGKGQVYMRGDWRPVDSDHARLSRDIGDAVNRALWKR